MNMDLEMIYIFLGVLIGLLLGTILGYQASYNHYVRGKKEVIAAMERAGILSMKFTPKDLKEFIGVK